MLISVRWVLNNATYVLQWQWTSCVRVTCNAWKNAPWPVARSVATLRGQLYSYVSKNVKLQRQIFLSTSLHLIFLKHSCISVDPDQNCIAEWRNNAIKFSFCRCKDVLAQSAHEYYRCKKYFFITHGACAYAVKTLPVLFQQKNQLIEFRTTRWPTETSKKM